MVTKCESNEVSLLEGVLLFSPNPDIFGEEIEDDIEEEIVKETEEKYFTSDSEEVSVYTKSKQKIPQR